MNAMSKLAGTEPSSDSLYNVINGRGETLMIGVMFAQASQTIDARQADPDMHPHWQGDMRIRLQRMCANLHQATPAVPA